MKSNTWIGFFWNKPGTETLVHLLPSSGKVTAPYQIAGKLKIFGSGIKSSSINLDGLRLGQPDGVRLGDVFPDLAKTSALLIGLEIEFSSAHTHVDLENSKCVIETCYKSHTLKYYPKLLGSTSEEPRLFIHDDSNYFSIVAVNTSEAPQKNTVRLWQDNKDMNLAKLLEVMPNNLQEYEWLNAKGFGALKFDEQDPDFCLFAVYKDQFSKQAVSVSVI